MDNKKKDVQTQQLNLMRIQTILIACILLIVVTVGAILATQFKSIKNCINLIEQNMLTIDTDALNEAVDAFTGAANQFNALDMNEFNDTVAALDDAAKQLKGVDVESLNSLVSALEDVATRLQNTVNAISGFLGR